MHSSHGISGKMKVEKAEKSHAEYLGKYAFLV